MMDLLATQTQTQRQYVINTSISITWIAIINVHNVSNDYCTLCD